MSMSHASEHRRAEIFKANTIRLRQRVFALEREVKSARTAGYIAGSAAMMAGVHDALNDSDLSLWISQRLLAQRRKCPPFNLSPEKQALVRAEIAALCKACGIKSNVEEISL
jgi:hypothetical protein